MTYPRHSTTADGRIDTLQAQVTALQNALAQLQGITEVDGVVTMTQIATTPEFGPQFLTSGIGTAPVTADVFAWCPILSTGSAGTVQTAVAFDGVTFTDLGNPLTVPASGEIAVTAYLRAGMAFMVTCVNCEPTELIYY